MRNLRFVGVVALGLGGCGKPAALAPGDAGVESRAIAAYIDLEYSEYLNNYIHVYLGYAACSYDFIDEGVLNDLADDVLRAMTARGVDLSRTQHANDPHPLPERAIQYAASLAVLTTMEMWSNAITAEVAPMYRGPDADCTASVVANRARYEWLKAFAIR